MIVPEFKLKQTQKQVQVFIRVPYIKVSSCEFYIQPSMFKFYLKPYLLSLTFQQSLKQAQQPLKATYYHDRYILQVHLQKQNPGQVFNNLDLIANLLNKKKQKKHPNKTLVQIVGQVSSSTVLEQSQKPQINIQYHYGFCMNYHNVLQYLDDQTLQLFAFNPSDTPMEERYPLSFTILKNNFDIDSYLSDKYQNLEEIQSILKNKQFQPTLLKLEQSRKQVQLNYSDFRTRLKLSSKQLLISPKGKLNVWRQISTIIFSYFYQLICMGGQMGPQSGKTINQTSSILNCNCLYYDMPLKQILIDCYRRCITYSLYKSLNIAKMAHLYMVDYLTLQRIKMIFEDVKKLMDQNEPRYLLNRLYFEDYLLFVYSAKSEQQLIKLSSELKEIKIVQDQLGLGIKQYEQSDNIPQQEEQEESQQQEKKQTKVLVQEMQQLQTLD